MVKSDLTEDEIEQRIRDAVQAERDMCALVLTCVLLVNEERFKGAKVDPVAYTKKLIEAIKDPSRRFRTY